MNLELFNTFANAAFLNSIIGIAIGINFHRQQGYGMPNNLIARFVMHLSTPNTFLSFQQMLSMASNSVSNILTETLRTGDWGEEAPRSGDWRLGRGGTPEWGLGLGR